MCRNLLPQKYEACNQHTHKGEIAERRDYGIHRGQHRLIGNHIRQGGCDEIQRDKTDCSYNQSPHPEHAVFGQIHKQLLTADQHPQQEQRGSLEETSVSPCPQKAEQLAVPQVGFDHRPEIRLRQERIHALAVNTPDTAAGT